MVTPDEQPASSETIDPDDTPEARRDRAIAFICITLALLVLVAAIWFMRPRPPQVDLPTPPIAYKVDINTADLSTLQLLPGVGPALAQKIIDERTRKPFASVMDLTRVSGIGAKTAAKMAPWVYVGQRGEGDSKP
jgi:competence ComEA-like helix-hairpin-helix protein